MRAVRLEGRGLHGGRAASVTLALADGPTTIAADGAVVPLHVASVVRLDHGVALTLGPSGPTIDLVEHLLSAMGALGAFEGLAIAVDGGEMPLLDGGAAEYLAALRSLAPPPRPTRPRRVVAPFAVEVGASRYELAPGDARRVEIEVAFAHVSIGKHSVTWSGDVDDYAARIAPARTFGFARDHAALVAAGRARGVDLARVVVFDDDGPLAPCRPVARDEPARHKLLDLIGDCALFGGPFLGCVRAVRPGHRATFEALSAATAAGALEAPWPPSAR